MSAVSLGTGRGLLLVVDAEGERVRLEVARELEGVFVDSFVAFIEREQMAPFFAAGRVGDGIVATSELIVGRAEEAIETSAPDQRAALASSAGGGAETKAGVGHGYDRPIATVATTQLQERRRSRRSWLTSPPWPLTTGRPISISTRPRRGNDDRPCSDPRANGQPGAFLPGLPASARA